MRGQTTLDYAIGMTVFLVTVSLVLAFLPGMLQPFVAGDQSNTVAANRIADHMVQGMLASPSDPYLLDAPCTAAFFGGGSATSCRYDTTNPRHEQLGVSDRMQVNVTIDFVNGTRACWDDDDAEVIKESLGDCSQSGDAVFESGDAEPGGSVSIVTANRVGSLQGRAVEVDVSVW